MLEPDIQAYISVMEEIKRRASVVGTVTSGQRNTLFRASNIELAALQVRMITELIALASLASHRALFEENQKKFSKHWHPDKIIKDVQKLNPQFYPKPITEAPSKQHGVKSEITPLADGFLTSDELVEVHGRCGSILHASNPYGKQRPYEEFEQRIPGWMARIRKLLNSHEIRLVDSADRFYLVHVQSEDDGKVKMYTFQRRDPPKDAEGSSQ